MIKSLIAWLSANLEHTTKWYEANTGAPNNPNTAKPYGIVEPGGLIQTIGGGGKQEIDLHLVFPAGSWVGPIEAAEELRMKLNGKTLTRNIGGELYRIEWESNIGGIYDATLKAFIYTCIFSTPIRV